MLIKYLSENKQNLNENLEILDESRMDKLFNGFTAQNYLDDLYTEFGQNEWTNKTNISVRARFAEKYGTLSKILLKNGYIEEVSPKTFKITDKGISQVSVETTKNTDEDGNDLAKGVKDISNLRSKKFKVPAVGNNSKYLDQMKIILSHMKSFSNGSVKTTYMIAGDVGTGKTQFIHSLSDLTGIPLVIIEAPHITQEHIINIPFLVLDGNKKHTGNISVDDSTMKVVQSESNLVTQLKSKKKRTDDQIMRKINQNKVLRDVYPKLEKRIEKIKDNYNAILFIDEYFRTSGPKIRNVLRNILNGKIGNDKIPKGVYVIMSTNIEDDGIDDIPLNNDFMVMNNDKADKEDFFNYMYGKYVDNPEDYDDETFDEENPNTVSEIAIKIDVWNKLYNLFEDNDLGYNDENSDVRFSPRRAEQFILYVNSVIPPKTIEEARALLTFVKSNFTNYLDGATSKQYEKFNKAIIELIEETTEFSEDDISKIEPLNSSDWRATLKQEILVKEDIGSERKYIPILSGAPGIGKTSEAITLAKDLEMGFIHVDVSNLTTEDLTGMPIANTTGDNITTEFSEPNLYITIMNEYNEIISDYKQDGRKYNVILLFDELNRTTVPVFNGLRKVLLEKSFESYELPEDIITMGAINPQDSGAIEFSKHVRDVLSIIKSSASFDKLFKYIENKPDLVKLSEEIGFPLHTAVSQVMSSLATDFKSEMDTDGNPLDNNERFFYWYVDDTQFYVSGREMTEAISNACFQIEDELYDMGWDAETKYSEEEFDAFIDATINIIAKSFMASLDMTAIKQDVSPDVIKMIGLKITQNDKFKKVLSVIKSKKSVNELSLKSILDKVNGDVSFLDKGVLGSYINYPTAPSEFIQDIANIVTDEIDKKDKIEVIPYLVDLKLRLVKILTSLNVTNQYIDMLDKYINSSLKNIMYSENFDIISFLKNEELIKKLGKLI